MSSQNSHSHTDINGKFSGQGRGSIGIPVMFIHGVTQIGGAERDLLVILEHLPRLGYYPVVVCPETGALVAELGRLGIEMRYVPLLAWRKVFAYLRRGNAIRRLREVITEVRPALIHVNDIWWVPQTLSAAKGMDIPILAHVRQAIEPWKARRYKLDRLTHVLPVSRQIHESLESGGVQRERLWTLYSGLDMTRVSQREDCASVRRRFGIPLHTPLIGTVANLFPRKGYDVILGALPAILSSFPEIDYVIVGRGNARYERTLRSLVSTLGLERSVHFAGFQESVYPILAALDVYVHPARYEGLPIAVLEAMAMEKPIVASRVGGIPEAVQDEVTGLLVPPDDPEALAFAVLRLLEDPHRRQGMGKAGKERLESHFTLDQTMKSLDNVYEKLLANQDGVWER